MVKYTIKLSKKALKDLELLQKSGRKSDIQKINIFFSEIEEDPRSGTGNPEQLKYYEGEVWSRKINKKDRFVYEIFETEIIITIVSSLGHYGDK